MATPSILIEQATLGAGTTGVSRRDGVISQVVTCTDTVNGAGTYLWTVHGPNGVSVSLTGATTATMTFTPSDTGVYLIFLLFNGSDASYTLDADGYLVSAQGGLSLVHLNGFHGIGGGESNQFSSVDGYALTHQEMVPKLARHDQSQTFTGSQQTKVTTLVDGATIPIDASANNAFNVTLGGARELSNPTNVVEGMSWVVRVIQDGTGLRALTFAANYEWATAGAPDLSADTAAQERLLTFYAVSPTKILAVDSLGVY